MSNHQTLDQAIENLAKALENVKKQDTSLSQMMDEFSKAVESYQVFHKNFSETLLDVKEMKLDPNGICVECVFEWETM